MQRVVSINLNGNAYQVEENGYNALFAYLDAFDARLKDSSERAQKLAELERTIAEKCEPYLNPHKTVITSVEIDRILLELEPPPAQPSDQRTADASSSSTSSSTSTGSTTSAGSTGWTPRAHRRLFQIREGAMISGVCMGLSEFLHIDVTIIRILFVLFAFATGGWGVLAYVALMFVTPRVDTRADAIDAAASGAIPPHKWPWDDGWPWDIHGWPWDTHGWPWDRDAKSTTPPQEPTSPQPSSQPAQRQQTPAEIRQAARDARAAWRARRRAARMAYSPHPWWGTMMMIFFLVFAFMWLSFWTRGHFFYGWPFFWGFWGFPHWIGIIVFFMLLRVIFMPFRAWRWYGYGYPYGPYAHPYHPWVAMWNGLAWFLVVIFVAWAAYHYIPEFHDFIREFRTGI